MKNKTDLCSVFFGTSRFSVFVLEELRRELLTPTLIVTAPDKPQGRKLIPAPPAVKEWAEAMHVDVVQPEELDDAFIAELANTPWDVFITASYGKILPSSLLNIPKHGALNVHPSLLPKYRGASPIPSQILADDRECGITIILMDEEMDHGPILAQARVEIDEDDWPLGARALEELLAVNGGSLLAETLYPWMNGEIKPEEQDHRAATFTKKLSKKDAELDIRHGDARANLLQIRARENAGGAYFFTERNGKKIRVKITDAELKDGSLVLTRVIPEGKKEMDYEDFLRAEQSRV